MQALNVAERTRLDESLTDYGTEKLKRIVDSGDGYVIMILNEQNATVPDRKMDYCLTLDKNKAKLFKAVLGYEDGDQEILKSEILSKVKSGNYVCQLSDKTQYGQLYNMHAVLAGKDGRKAIRTER